MPSAELSRERHSSSSQTLFPHKGLCIYAVRRAQQASEENSHRPRWKKDSSFSLPIRIESIAGGPGDTHLVSQHNPIGRSTSCRGAGGKLERITRSRICNRTKENIHGMSAIILYLTATPTDVRHPKGLKGVGGCDGRRSVRARPGPRSNLSEARRRKKKKEGNGPKEIFQALVLKLGRGRMTLPGVERKGGAKAPPITAQRRQR